MTRFDDPGGFIERSLAGSPNPNHRKAVCAGSESFRKRGMPGAIRAFFRA